METTQDINSILSKLKKLQRLYEGAKAINSEAEAANAAAKIQNLLTQYNLSMADLDSVADDSQKSSVTEDQLDDRWSRKTGGAWDQLLLYGICKYNFCYTIVSQKHTSRITSGGRLVYEVRRKFIVIGEQQNIEVVKWLFAVLSRQLYELSKKRYKEYLADDSQALIRSFTGEKRMSPAKFHRSYLAGAAKGVQDRLKEERDRELQAQVQVNALVLRTDQKLNDYVVENYKDLRSSRPMHIGSGHAMAMGREDGRKVNITRGGIAASNTNPNQIAQ